MIRNELRKGRLQEGLQDDTEKLTMMMIGKHFEQKKEHEALLSLCVCVSACVRMCVCICVVCTEF